MTSARDVATARRNAGAVPDDRDPRRKYARRVCDQAERLAKGELPTEGWWPLAGAFRKLALPCQRVRDDDLQIVKARLPSEGGTDSVAGGHDLCRVARPPWCELDLEVDARDTFDDVNHIQHGKAVAVTAIERRGVVMLDSRNNLVRSEESILTTVLGVDDMTVVSTADAVLVSPRAKAEEVKTLVEQLKANNYRVGMEHRRIYRPWGYYQDVDSAPRYQVKRIVVKPGSKLSLQKHFHRSEHWVVVKGTAEVTLSSDVRSLHENESIYIPIGAVHRLANPGKIPLELIEVQVGSYLGEDDIVRMADVYGRVV